MALKPFAVAAPRSVRRAMNRRRNRGQALVWLLGTMAASAAVLYGVYNVGQLTNGKQKVINAADGAALAGASIEARALNLMAYNNRAVIANEVFMIQAVAMQGWFQYIKTTSGNIAPYVEWIPYIGEVLGPILEYISEASMYGEDILMEVNPVLIRLLETFKSVVSAGHSVARLTGSVGAYQAATDVVAANRSEFGTHKDVAMAVESRAAVKVFSYTQNGTQWTNFTKQYSTSGSDRDDAKDVLLRSRDEFTSKSRPGADWMTPNLGVVGFEKMGGTELQGYDRWETQDTYENWVWTWCGKSPLPKRCYTPIGWGRANADNSGSSGGTWSPNRDAQNNARNDGDTNSGWSGVPKLYNVAKKDGRETLGVNFVIAVKRDKAANLTSQTMKIGLSEPAVTGSANMDEQLVADQMSSIGKARATFERPQTGIGDKTASTLFRHDEAKEYGSLYSPFWQARLVDVSMSERVAYMTALGMSPADAAAAAKLTPGAQ